MSVQDEVQIQLLAEISDRNIVEFYLNELKAISLRGFRKYDLTVNTRKKLLKLGVLKVARDTDSSGFCGRKTRVNWERVQKILA